MSLSENLPLPSTGEIKKYKVYVPIVSGEESDFYIGQLAFWNADGNLTGISSGNDFAGVVEDFKDRRSQVVPSLHDRFYAIITEPGYEDLLSDPAPPPTKAGIIFNCAFHFINTQLSADTVGLPVYAVDNDPRNLTTDDLDEYGDSLNYSLVGRHVEQRDDGSSVVIPMFMTV